MKLFAISFAFIYLILISSLANASAVSQEIGNDVLLNLVENIPYNGDNPPYSYDNNGNAESQPFSIAIPARNLSRGSAWDLLLLNIMSNATDGPIVSEVSAIKGSDGSLMWQKTYPDAIVYAFPVDDLNGDGGSDIVVDMVLAGMSFIPYSKLIVLNGFNGTEIWSKPAILSTTIAYPLNKTELLVHFFSIDPINKSAVTKISSILARNGSEIDSRTFQGAIAVEYPAKNLTGYKTRDSIMAAYNIDETNSSVTTRISALRNLNRSALWNKTFSGVAIAIPNDDVTGDGLSDIIVYELHPEENSTNTSIDLLSGANGRMLWIRQLNGSIGITSIVPDLTGDGLKDFIIYKFGGSDKEATSVEAVKGDTGLLLWSKPSMIFLPQ